MKVCLDTNAYSDLRRGDTRIRDILDRAEEVLVPAAVVGELQLGFLRGSKCAENESMLNQFLSMPCVTFQPVTRSIAERYGYVKAALWKAGKAIPENDIWIAATALETGARLLTRDAHFDAVGGLIRIAKDKE